MTPEPLHVAQSVAAQGFPVFPCRAKAGTTRNGEKRPRKAPHVTGWQEKATTDPAQIAKYWERWPDALIGLHAAKGGIVVVDLDRDKGEGAGRDNLAAAGLVLPPTFTYATPSGGEHHVYAAPPGRTLSGPQGHPVPGVDIRAGETFPIYYGPVLDGPPKLAPAPPFAIVDGDARGAKGDPSATVELWRERQSTGKPSKRAHRAAAKIREHDTDTEAVRRAISTIVGESKRNPGDYAPLIDEVRERWTLNYPAYVARFDGLLEGSVQKFGPWPQTIRLSKVERRALKARGKAPEPEGDDEPAAPLYEDVAAVLDGGLERPKPTEGSIRADGLPLLYGSAVNGYIGPPESAKTLTATAMVADTLARGGSALWVDVDHNGAPATIARLVEAGVERDVLVDLSRFRLVIGESREELERVVADAVREPPTIAVFDSVGEIMPLYGADSNSADDYSGVHRAVFAPVAAAGAAVLILDHVAKTAAGSGYASGSGAKKRAIDGALYELKVLETFRPGVGGAAALVVQKDRHGGIRAATEGDTAAVFRLDSRAGSMTWEFHTPRSADERADEQAGADVAFVLALDPFPTSKERLLAAVRAATGKGWRAERAHAALTAARERRAHLATFPLDTDSTD